MCDELSHFLIATLRCPFDISLTGRWNSIGLFNVFSSCRRIVLTPDQHFNLVQIILSSNVIKCVLERVINTRYGLKQHPWKGNFNDCPIMELGFDREAESAATVIVHHTTNRTSGQQLYKGPARRCVSGCRSGLTPVMSAVYVEGLLVKSVVYGRVTRRTLKSHHKSNPALRPIMDLVSPVAGHGGPRTSCTGWDSSLRINRCWTFRWMFLCVLEININQLKPL